MLQETVGVFSDPERGAARLASGTAMIRVASWRTSAASSRSELVIVPSLFVEEMRSEMMSTGQGWRHTISFPERYRSSHTPPDPSPEASQNLRWVGFRTDNIENVSWLVSCLIRQHFPVRDIMEEV